MAYDLAENDITAALIACVLVDDEDTIVDLVPGNTFTLDAGVAGTVATADWKGVSRKHFVVSANGPFDFFGLRWTGTLPVANQTDSDGMATWFSCAGASNCSSLGRSFLQVATAAGNVQGAQRVSAADARGRFMPAGGTQATTTSNLPTDGTTPFSVGFNYRNDFGSEAYYALEANSMALEATAGADGGWGSATAAVRSIGGDQSQGSQPHSPFIHLAFNRWLTLAEYDALHEDWFSVIVASSGAGIALEDPVWHPLQAQTNPSVIMVF